MMSITGLALLIAAVGILIMVMVILMEPRRQTTLRPGVYMDANGRYVPYQGGGAPAPIGIMTAVLDDERAMVRIRQ